MKKLQSSDLMNGLSKGFSADSDGNVTVGKDLEVDGKTKLNGGFEPMYVYDFEDAEGNTEQLYIFYETENEDIGGYDFFGTLSNCFYIYGNYYLTASSELDGFSGLAFGGEEQTPINFVWSSSDKTILRYYVTLSERGNSIFEYTLKLNFLGAGASNVAYLNISATKFMTNINSVTDFNTLVDAQDGDCIAVIVSKSTEEGVKLLGNNMRFESGVWTLYIDDTKYSTSYQGSIVNLNLTSVTQLQRKQF